MIDSGGSGAALVISRRRAAALPSASGYNAPWRSLASRYDRGVCSRSWVRAGCASGIAASAAPDRAHELGAGGTRIADRLQSQLPRKPARRSPTFTYGQRRMISQIKPVR